MSYSKEQIQNTLKTLPGPIQGAVLSPEVGDLFVEIIDSSGLPEEKHGDLRSEILYLMIALTTPQDFQKNLVSSLGMSNEQALATARAVDLKLLLPIKKDLDDLYAKVARVAPLQVQTPKLPVTTPPPTPSKPPVVSTEPPQVPKPPPKMEISTLPSMETPKMPPPPQGGPIPNLRTMPRDMARLKLENSVRLPKEEISMRYKTEEAQHSTPSKVTGPKNQTPAAPSTDPYREPPQ